MGGNSNVRKRKGPSIDTTKEPSAEPLTENRLDKAKLLKPPINTKVWEQAQKKKWAIAFVLLTFLTIATRFWRIEDPHEVVFDEVHFGKFASYYLKRTYFFDVHPPLGKLILAAAGYIVGYRGSFMFESIGDDYIENGVPYVSLRIVPAMFGVGIIPIFILIMKEMHVSLTATVIGSLMLILDNSLIMQSKFILLDTMLLFFGLCSIYSWIKFYKRRYQPFSLQWWLWMVNTGVCLGLTTSVKLVGLFTVLTIGAAVLIDLWRLLDFRRGYSMDYIARHFLARALCLIGVPLIVYSCFFYLHFAILTKSGPGDAFMSANFQVELEGSEIGTSSLCKLLMDSLITAVFYNSNLTLKHRKLKVFLDSREERYPLVYPDGRVSTKGRQVTGASAESRNSYWNIEAADPALYPKFKPSPLSSQEIEKKAKFVRNGDVIRLRHVITNEYLRTHDVASTLMSTNMEMTTTADESVYNQTLWRIEVSKEETGARVRTKRDYLKLINVVHNVALCSHSKDLPDWGFNHKEVNGNKNLGQAINVWFFDKEEHERIDNGKEVNDNTDSKNPRKKLSFILKFLELQNAMLSRNSAISKKHPYSSRPEQWPLLLTGISYWEKKEGLRQLYFLGNPIVYWSAFVMLLVYIFMWTIDKLMMQRGIDEYGIHVRRWWDRTAGFIFMAWAIHFFPFFLMQRVLFFHHYLPSLIYSVMLFTLSLDFIARVTAEEHFVSNSIRIMAPNLRVDSWMRSSGSFSFVIVGCVIVVVVGAAFVFFAPLTYALSMDSRDAVKLRRWLKVWELQHS